VWGAFQSAGIHLPLPLATHGRSTVIDKDADDVIWGWLAPDAEAEVMARIWSNIDRLVAECEIVIFEENIKRFIDMLIAKDLDENLQRILNDEEGDHAG
jgi:hypothetical protein